MELSPPFIITPRLLAGFKVGEAFISIDYDGETSSGRTRYRYYLDLPDGTEFSSNDLKSGVGGGSLQEGMSSLLSFLGAAAESYSYRQRTGRVGENEDLFTPTVVEWAHQNSDEISMLNYEVDENPDLIKE